MRLRGKQVQYISYFPPKMLEKLQKLSKKTRVPIAAYIRMGVEYVLKKNGVKWKP